MSVREAVVACGEKMSAGITVWDAETGEVLLRIPTCASPPHGLLCLPNQLLIASQLQNHRPFGGGAIFFWAFNKPQAPCRSYPAEAIGPIAISKDGTYIVGGAPSGNAYIWEVPSGRLLKKWQAHHGTLNCLAFSEDDSLLISSSEDGTIRVWLTIRVLNIADPQACGSMPSFHTWSEHGSSITGLLPISGGSSPRLISGSLDGTCKVWDLVSGRLLQTHFFSVAVTAIAVDHGDYLLFAGCADGRIYVSALDLGMQEDPVVVSEDEAGVLCGHKGPITALTFSPRGLGLISGAKDGTACLWDAKKWQAIRRFSHGKGHVTNILAIPWSLLSVIGNQRSCLRPRVSLLDKAPRTNLATEGTLTLLPQCCSREDCLVPNNFRTSNLLNKQILDLEWEFEHWQRGRTPEAIQMKAETCVENRLWAVTMTKHVTAVNKHLQSRLIDMMQRRLCQDSEIAQASGKKGKISDPEELTEPPK